MRFPGVHAVATTPAQRLGAHFAHFPSRISLPRSRSRVGLRIVLFEACSAFTHAVATTPAQRLGAHFAHFPSRISLPRSRSRVGLRIVLFEACSAFTHVTACTLARSPIRDSLHQRLQPFRYLHSCSGCFRLERLPGGAFTHWEKRRLTTAHPKKRTVRILRGHVQPNNSKHLQADIQILPGNVEWAALRLQKTRGSFRFGNAF